MATVIRKHLLFLSWGGILILCLAVCLQMLGVPGTLFSFVDFEDDFQASVITGYTITSGSVSFSPYLTPVFTFVDNSRLNDFLSSDALFHPPLLL